MVVITLELDVEFNLDKKYQQNLCIAWLPIPMSEITKDLQIQ